MTCLSGGERTGGSSEAELSAEQAARLDEAGFVLIPDAIAPGAMERLALAYDHAVATAAPEDVRVGSTTTRVRDFVNRGPLFDDVYLFPPLLDACRRIIGHDFKLSSLHARTLHPGAGAQALHVDVRRESADWPLVGFILMVDAFRGDNGATRFVPGSHLGTPSPEEAVIDAKGPFPGEVQAVGPAGSLLIFHGSVWHGHAANASDRPRRSLQGALIPAGGRAETDFRSRMTAETLNQLSPVARRLLGVGEGMGWA